MHCCLCSFQAFSKANLSFHLNAVHFRDKEYMCRLCHFKTAYKGALTRHVNSVHLRTGAIKDCPICPYTTSSLLTLNSHLSSKHFLDIAMAFTRPSSANCTASGKNSCKGSTVSSTSSSSRAGTTANSVFIRQCSVPSPPTQTVVPIVTPTCQPSAQHRMLDTSLDTPHTINLNLQNISRAGTLLGGPLNLAVGHYVSQPCASSVDTICSVNNNSAIDMVIRKSDDCETGMTSKDVKDALYTSDNLRTRQVLSSDPLLRGGEPSLVRSDLKFANSSVNGYWPLCDTAFQGQNNLGGGNCADTHHVVPCVSDTPEFSSSLLPSHNLLPTGNYMDRINCTGADTGHNNSNVVSPALRPSLNYNETLLAAQRQQQSQKTHLPPLVYRCT